MKSCFEEHGGTYTKVGGFLIPDLVLEEQSRGRVGKYGRIRLEFLKKWKKSLYNDMVFSGQLQKLLLGIDRNIREAFESIVRQTAKAEGVNEELKKPDQMAWVRRISNISDWVDKFIKYGLI